MDLSSESEAPRRNGWSRKYICIDCDRQTNNPRLYLEHRRDFHCELISIHACDLCIYASKHSQKLARHRRTVHRNIIQSLPVSTKISSTKIKNGMIEKPNKMQLISRESNAKKSRDLTCKWCMYVTINKNTMIDHIRAVHPKVDIFNCDSCTYMHYIRERFNRHRRYHTMSYVQCKICEFQTIYKWNLERHMKHHMDAPAYGSYRCSKCNFTATTKQSITAHEAGHHSDVNEVNMEENIDVKVNNDNSFDASAFLELIWSNSSPMKNESEINVDKTKMEIKNSNKSKQTKYFHCCNCNFR